MEDYAGRILSDRYRLPIPPSDEYELTETRAFDTRSGQEVLVRQVPLPEVVDAELLDGSGAQAVAAGEPPAVRRAIAAAQAAASVPDHPRLDQVFDVFAEDGSLWIVSELVPARPLAALIADEPLSPYRAAEVASDVLTALRVLHAHGWTHRNITARTVLICEDGRVVLTGLAAGAAEEALCGYDPVPPPDTGEPGGDAGADAAWGTPPPQAPPPDPGPEPPPAGARDEGPRYAPLVAPGYDTGPRYTDHITPEREREPRPQPARPAPPGQDRAAAEAAARAGTVAAYRAGTRAASAEVARQRGGRGPVVVPVLPPTGANLPQEYAYPYGGPDTAAGTPWHGVAPRRPADPQRPPEPEPERPEQPEPRLQQPERPQLQQSERPEPQQPQLQQPWQPEPRQAQLQQPAPPQPEPAPVRPVLPAQLALPQGYRQAEPPAPAAPPAPPAPTGQPPRPQAPRPLTAPAPAQGGRADAGAARGGPRTGLDAERARQTRMAVVGPLTERWAPEQAAGPVHGNWQLAPPVGPATDLWALGALLYRAVQGHAPYPEDSVAELVEMVCAEPPAFAEDCGPLRPVVESLLRQDPAERPDFEELRGWLRSLVRSAPEPDGDFAGLPMPEPDPARLPVVRRRGDLHGRHRNPAVSRRPRSLGRLLLVGVLVLLTGGVAYAVVFLPRAADSGQQPTAARSPAASAPGPGGSQQGPASKPAQTPGRTPGGTPESKPAPQGDAPAPEGYTVQQDPAHFVIAVPNGWERQSINEAGQVRYTQGQFTLIVVPGRDRVEGADPDPLGYQKDKEPELAPYRNSTWASGGDVKSTRVGQQLRVTGRYTWIDAAGRSLFARNFVVALGGAYHVVMVTGPEDNQDKVTDVFEKATASYKAGG
ncbi:protein kinase [Streptomyces sp. W1SF4]|uniref:protein kinase n=1 Tax=Streptomyces sp. W1SF4 TaxID=2305220 RepID=UPI000F7023D2|nr:protein kinase [Streptomyces sp. W1SF4]AZM90670.1 serine/threonine protein kinase [Streptomyces sp. W1SF4]